ncbi:MAG TPA: ATP synthase F0 subunit C [Clostridia bacterium]|nr:ATP synthase F0 subunit C [Clostridia bacterium]
MTDAGILAICAAVTIILTTVTPGIAQAKATSKAMEAMSRQPEAAGDMRTSLIVALAFMEALTIYGLLVAILILGKIPNLVDLLS